jgi:hypothetical protein
MQLILNAGILLLKNNTIHCLMYKNIALDLYVIIVVHNCVDNIPHVRKFFEYFNEIIPQSEIYSYLDL